MKKSDAIELLGSNITEVSKILGVSRYTVYRWPDELPQNIEDQVRGAYYRITEEKDRKATIIFGE